MAYNIKFKTRAIEYREKRNSVRKTAETFGISPNTLNTWLREYEGHGEFLIKLRPANRTKLTEEVLLAYYQDNPVSYQQEVADHFGVTQAGVSKALKRLNITRKKR